MSNIKRSAAMRMALLAALAAIMILSGCGAPPSPSGDTAGVPAQGATVSANSAITECYGCHSDSANPAGLSVVTGDSDASKIANTGWLKGPHGNYEVGDPAAIGDPQYPVFTDSTCKTCHDPNDDGRAIDDYYTSTGGQGIGIVERPIVGCAACHGTAYNHFGVGPMPAVTVDACASTCHNDNYPDNAPHGKPGQNRIYEDFASSLHNAVGDTRQQCSKCHTHEGAKLYLSNTPSQLSSGSFLPVSSPNSIKCDTCHDGHNPDILLKAAGTDFFGNTASAQYKTCTNCHEEQGALHGETDSGNYINVPGGRKMFNPSGIIYDTHFDYNVYSPAGNYNSGGIEGYIINAAEPDACSSCHNVHATDLSINEQWARSGHGGFILYVKEQALDWVANADPALAIVNASAILNGTDTLGALADSTPNYTAPAWSHYNFKASNRAACQRCHTATGFRNFANNPVLYDTDRNETPDAPNVYYAKESQKEMLYCWACHTSASDGTLRDPGAMPSYMTLNAPMAWLNAPMARLMNVPDVDGSNVCIACHSGRKTGEQIKNLASAPTSNFGSYAPHYLQAAAILYRYGGYEYRASADYDDYSYFTHGRIGNSIAVGGGNGPCVACHMRSDEGHKMEAITPAPPAAITNIPTYDLSCSSCHSSKAFLITDLNTKRGGFEDALNSIVNALEGRGIFYNSSAHPYFYNSKTVHTTATRYTAWATKDSLGAAFNFFILAHEPGAYAHNSRYTKRLLYDTFDYLNNGVQDNNVAGGDVLDLSGIPDPEAYQFIGSGTRP